MSVTSVTALATGHETVQKTDSATEDVDAPGLHAGEGEKKCCITSTNRRDRDEMFCV